MNASRCVTLGMGEIDKWPPESRDWIDRHIINALRDRVKLDSVTAFFALDGNQDRANAKLRDSLRELLADGDELWYFSTPFENLSGMAGYAVLTNGNLKDFVVTVQS